MDSDLNKLSKTLMSLKKEKELKDFLSFVLTEKEIKAISKRIEILSLLTKGISQRKISGKLGVGIATVTHGAKELALKKKQNKVWKDFKAWRD